MSFKHPKKIFVIDDDEIIRMAMEDYLTKDNDNEVFTFATGEDAMKQIHMSPDVVVLDYNLNSVSKDAANGLTTMEEMRKLHSNIHFIIMSSQDSYGLALQMIQKGAEQYIIKDADSFQNVADIIEELP